MKLCGILACIALSLFYKANAQNIDSTIEKYANDYGNERAYLHYDKASYAPGETVWYKAYLMQGIYPATESKTLYFDWTDDKGNLLLHGAAPLIGATSAGQFDIPAAYAGKFIHIKAYTKWMLNFDSAFLYNTDIRILTKNNISQASKTSIIPSIQFFPEGGDIVANIDNKIAFKVNDQFGRPVSIKGNVLDNAGKMVDSLHITHDGMGYFFLTPREGEVLTAKWKDEKGKMYSSDLPSVKTSGVALHVTLSNKNRIFSILASPEQATALGKVYVIGTMYQHEIFKVTKEIKTGEAKGTIPTENLPTGIMTITVFNDQWVPLAERITFINNQEYAFYPEMEVQHWGLNKRARNEVQITVPDSVAASFSVSVTDIDIDADSSDHIISHLLLTGELKGKVFNPAWYFTNSSDSLSKQLDLVMLTHGWRRFNWEDVAKGKFPKISYGRDTSYLTLSGKLYGASTSQLRDADNIILLINNAVHGNQMLVLPVLPNGTFNDPTYLLFDTANIHYQLSKAKGLGDISVKFMEGRLPPLVSNISANGNYYSRFFDTAGNARHLALANELADILNKYKGKVLETVKINLKIKTPLQILDEKYASGLFSGGDAYQFDLVHDTRARGATDIFRYLQGQVAGLQISIGGDGTPSMQWRGSKPQLFVDEVPTDVSMVSSLSVTDVAYIKVMRPPFFGASGGGAGGAIAIYTRRGDDAKIDGGKGLPGSIVTGYTKIREFYSPNYGTFNADDEKQDIRTTLYWNPQIITSDVNNKVTFTFYNTDITKAFRVTIEGMTKDGRLAHLEQIME
ncbi:MAG: hypothetical protein ABJA90_07010 [Ginsengibacter sp.]